MNHLNFNDLFEKIDSGPLNFFFMKISLSIRFAKKQYRMKGHYDYRIWLSEKFACSRFATEEVLG